MTSPLPASAWQTAWPAPAKINLFLHVTGRRADGYHLLQTVFQFLGHGDTLRFEPRTDGRIVLANPIPGVAPESDLTVRAARALQAASGCAQGATLHLEKRLPMGGGLGGGSSDAATTLLALNALWGCGLDRLALQTIGLTLGADVPVFIHGRATFAEGIGEAFSDVLPAEDWYLVLIPPVGVPTADIFRSPLLRRDTAPMRPADWQPGKGHNDLEPVACALFPEVALHLDLLRAFGDARMSGSGACCFVAFDSEVKALAAFRSLPPGIRGFVAKGNNVNPIFFNCFVEL